MYIKCGSCAIPKKGRRYARNTTYQCASGGRYARGSCADVLEHGLHSNLATQAHILMLAGSALACQEHGSVLQCGLESPAMSQSVRKRGSQKRIRYHTVPTIISTPKFVDPLLIAPRYQTHTMTDRRNTHTYTPLSPPPTPFTSANLHHIHTLLPFPRQPPPHPYR